jgi:diaminopimelate decarboxylase
MDSQQSKIDRLSALLGRVDGPEAVLGGETISKLSERITTPFYWYNGDVVAAQVQRVRAALGEHASVVYSVKANPSLALCQIIAGQGIGCEVASIGELILAERAGFPVDRIMFIGPGKTDDELMAAIDMGIEAIIVESPGEIRRIARMAKERRTRMRIGIRINVSAQVKGYGMRMGGGAQQFGIDEELLPEVIAEHRDDANVEICGVQVYAGSQQFDIDALLAHCHHVIDLGLSVADMLGRPLEFIDLGGGFGVPYFENTQEFDLDAFSEGFESVVSRCRSDHRLAGAHVVIELGRYLVAQAGLYVMRAVDVKTSHGKTFVVTDGGMNHHIAGTGNFGQVFRKPFPIAVLNRMNAEKVRDTAVVGPNCTPLDTFAQNLSMPIVEAGDLLGVYYSGAYGYSASSLGFLSHPTPAEVLFWNGETHMLRKPGRPDAVLQGQAGLPEADVDRLVKVTGKASPQQAVAD